MKRRHIYLHMEIVWVVVSLAGQRELIPKIGELQEYRPARQFDLFVDYSMPLQDKSNRIWILLNE